MSNEPKKAERNSGPLNDKEIAERRAWNETSPPNSAVTRYLATIDALTADKVRLVDRLTSLLYSYEASRDIIKQSRRCVCGEATQISKCLEDIECEIATTKDLIRTVGEAGE